MNFADVRSQYPQYGDMSDEQLANALHQKFYPDMAFQDFSQKVGFSARPPVDQSVMDANDARARAAAEQTPTSSLKNLASKLLAPHIGTAEAIVGAGTGLAGSITGGLAGLADLGLSAIDAGTGFPGTTSRTVQEAMTYQPRTQAGQDISRIAGYPMELYGRGVHAVGGAIRGLDSGGMRDLAATTAEVLGESAPVALGGAQALRAARAVTPPPLTRPQQMLAAAQQEGYVVPPSQMGVPNLMEGVGGKIRTAQTASARNQTVTNRLAVKELGLPEGTTLTDDLLSRMREKAYNNGYVPLKQYSQKITADNQFIVDVLDLSKDADRLRVAYPDLSVAGADKVAKLADGILVQSQSADAAVSLIKQLRSEASRNLSWKAQPNADTMALGQAQKAAANAVESLIERNLTQTGQTSLLEQFRAARQQIAKTHSVQDALNDTTGNVSARALAASKQANAMTGGLRTAANFARGFPKANQMMETFGGTPPISPLDVSMGSALAIGGQLATGNVGGAAMGGVPLLRPMAAPLALRPGVQRGLLNTPAPTPDFGVGPYAMPWLIPPLQDQQR